MIDPVFVGSLYQQVIQALYVMVYVPFTSNAMLWACAPIFLSLTVLRLYFGIYTHEKLGWNSVISNALILMWVGINSLKYTLDLSFFSFGNEKAMLSVIMLAVGFVIIVISFLHAIPEGFMFTIASSFSIQFLSYLCVLFIYTDFPFTEVSLIASVILFIVVWMFFRVVRMFEPSED